MKKIETFIVVHSQDIINDYAQIQKFNNFPNVKYVFVGSGSLDKISDLSNIIVARDLPINIENIPNLVAFTAWYALIKNNLITSEYVNLFEYDVNYTSNCSDIINENINADVDVIGYFPTEIGDYNFYQNPIFCKPLTESIRTRLNVDIEQYILDLYNKTPSLKWSATTNFTWKTTALKQYIGWVEQFIEDIKDIPQCGHMVERSISFYILLHKLQQYIIPNIITHLQLNSHHTDPYADPQKFAKYYNNLI